MKHLAAIALACVVAAGCNTMEGLGRDISGIGDALTGASQEVQNAPAPARKTDNELAGAPGSRRP